MKAEGETEIQDRESGNRESRNRKFLHLKAESLKLKFKKILVRSKISDFGVEIPRLSDFEIPDFLIPDLRYSISWHDSGIPWNLEHKKVPQCHREAALRDERIGVVYGCGLNPFAQPAEIFVLRCRRDRASATRIIYRTRKQSWQRAFLSDSRQLETEMSGANSLILAAPNSTL